MIRFSLLLENVKQAKQLLAKLNIDPSKDSDYLKIREMLNGNDGYTYWFCHLHFVNKTPLNELENIWEIIKSDRATISKFEKPLIELKTIEEFWDQYYKLKGQTIIRSTYNKFLPEQKAFINLEKDNDLLDALSKRKDADDNFFNKSKRYHNRESLVNAIKLFLSADSNSNFDTLLRNLDNDDVDIRFYNKENNIIIVTVNYQQLKKYGGDTSWCIVGSESTFKSYNSYNLSQQFIIFNTDRTDNYCKIGVTTNVNGFYTAHLRNDAMFDQPSLKSFLDNKDVKFSVLMPSKENIQALKSWANIRVDSLINIGFTKEEIVDKKEVYNSRDVYGRYSSDLDSFTKEEIDKWNLLDKTELNIDDLKKYTVEEIITKNLLNRVPSYNLSNLRTLGFSDEQCKEILLKKLSLTSNDLQVFSYDEIISNKLLEKCPGLSLGEMGLLKFPLEEIKKVAKGRTDDISTIILKRNRQQIIKVILDHFLSNLGFNVEYSDRDRIKRDLISIVRPTKDEIKFSTLADICKKDRDIKEIINYFDQIEYPLDESDIKYLVSGNTLLSTISYLIHNNIHVDTCISIIQNTIDSATEELKTVKARYSRYKYVLAKSSIIMQQVKISLSKYPDLYTELYNICKEILIGLPDELRIMQGSDNDRSDKKMSMEGTFTNIEFWQCEDILKDIDTITTIFYYAGLDNVGILFNFLKKKNIILDESQSFTVLKGVKNYAGDIQVLISSIKNGIYVDSSYRKLVEYAKSQKDKLSYSERNEIKSILSNHDTYKKDWEKYEELEIFNNAIKATKSIAKYTWGISNEHRTETPESWYTKYWPLIKDADWESIFKKYDSFEGKTFISAIVILSHLNKMEEADDINWDFIFNYKSRNSTLKSLSKVIADKAITNWRRTWELKLSDDQRKSIYDWLYPIVMREAFSDPEESPFEILGMISPCIYIYDKDKFWKLVDKLKTLKNNIYTDTHNDVDRFMTFRLGPISGAIIYMAEEGYFEDIEKILKEFSELKMSKKEIESSYYIGYGANLFYSRVIDKDGKKHDLYDRGTSAVNKPKLMVLFDKYFKNKEPIKRVKKVVENIILRWNDFKIKE